ncbi:MAG: Permease of the drug/metabolite transporter [Myxococcaceae bacterium]|nr:Permease of the drug/metabolite transporter [Myxococcaceae bacterium]
MSAGARPIPGVAVIAFSSLPFASMAVLARTLAGVVPSSQVVAARFLVGLIGVGLLFAVTRTRPNLRRWPLLLVRGVFGGAAVLCYFFAISHLGVGPATMLNYLAPVYAAVFAGVILKERPGLWLYAGLVLATLGAITVTAGTGAFEHPLRPGLGALAGIASGIFGGASMTGVHALRKDTDASTVFFGFCLIGLLIAAPLAADGWVPLEGATLLRVIGIGVLSFLAQMLFSWGMGFTTASRGSATTQLIPVVTWVLSVWLLGDWPNPVTLAGAVLCLAGVLIGLVPPAPALEKAEVALPP